MFLGVQKFGDKSDFAIFPEKWIKKEFLEEFIKCSKYFAELQTTSISMNLG